MTPITENHLVISNFNTIPLSLTRYSDNFTLYDQSTDLEIRHAVLDAFPQTISTKNCGHSLANFFNFIANNYKSLPKVVVLLKGNIIGRHVTEGFLKTRITNSVYTPLFNSPSFTPTLGISSRLADGLILEINNSWYVDRSRARYLANYTDLLHLLYLNPVTPEFVAFAPGGCYVVPRNMLERIPQALWSSLAWLTSYDFFPPEAYLIERVMHTLLTSHNDFQPWCYSESAFRNQLRRRKDVKGAKKTPLHAAQRAWRSVKMAKTHYRQYPFEE